MQRLEETNDGRTEINSIEEGHQGCNCSSAAPRQEDVSEPNTVPLDDTATGFGPDGAEIDDEPTAIKSLATMHLSNGARIEFTAMEEGGGAPGIALRELGDSRRMMLPVLPKLANLSSLEIYSKLSPKAPVPRLLAAQAKGKSSRALIDTLDEPIEVDLDELGPLAPVKRGSDSGGGFGGHFCVPGAGWHDFKAFACNGAAYPANTWHWCDPNAAYYWRDRWTVGHPRKRSVGITATCGGPAEIRHYYKKKVNGKWKKLKTWYLPQSHWAWTRYDGTAKRDRWIKHLSSIQGSPSFVRSATYIFT